MSLNINVIKDFNVFVNGDNYAGKSKSLTLPKLANVMEEYRGAGMLAADQVRMGYEKLEAEVVMASFEPAVMKEVAHMTGSTVMEFRGAMVNERKNEVAEAVVTMDGFVSEMDAGSWESGKLGEVKFAYKCHAYKLVVGGAVIHDVDIEKGKAVIGGVDQYGQIANALRLNV